MKKIGCRKDFVEKLETIPNHEVQEREHGEIHAPFAVFGVLTRLSFCSIIKVQPARSLVSKVATRGGIC